MTAYYNEIDPEKAAWIRELIKANVVAPGDVDERDIKLVQPDDLRGYRQCHFFAGIAVWSYALRLADWPDDREVWTGSCPCPSFSSAGKGQGFDDARHLWPDWYGLIRECKPATVFGEQADDAIGYGWLDLVQAQMEAENYAVGKAVLASASVGGADLRERLYFVAESEHHGRNRPQRAEAITHSDQPGIGIFERDSAIGGMANPEHSERRPVMQHREDGRDRENAGRTQAYRQPRACGEICSLANTSGSRCDEAREHRSGSPLLSARSEQCSGAGELGDSAARGFAMRGSAPGSTGHPAQSGILGGIWSNAEWIWCRDNKYRPVEPVSQSLVDGTPESLGRVRGENLKEAEEEIIETAKRYQVDPREAMLYLWQAYAEKTLEHRGFGRFDGIWQAPVLFSFMRQLTQQGWSFTQGIPRQSTEDAREMLRGVRGRQETSCSSCGRGLDKQRPEQCSNPLHILSSVLARHAQAAWGEAFDAHAAATFPLARGSTNRVLKLRGYGDAINAEVAKAWIETYIDARA